MSEIQLYLSLLILTPLISALIGGLLGHRVPGLAKWLSVASAMLVACLAIMLAHVTWGPVAFSFSWFQLGSLQVNAGILYTPLASLMCLVIGLVAVAVHLFSLQYLKSDVAQPRYFAGLSLFTCAMLGLTLADNLLMLFAFWEMVGFGSYLLIGHYSSPTAARAANKAFLVNRIADVFFLAGIALLFVCTDTLNIPLLASRFATLQAELQLTIASLLLAGVIAKSAQLPGHLWLPDAMAGPTPVSALIHAATMVAAGVYLLCRLQFAFQPILLPIAWLGALTALLAAIWAFGQTDLKRVLAYSTISQLGFMVAGVGLGSPQAAFFHLTTHAFFKALLFLCAGAIIDACHHQQDSARMGGLWRRLPFTFAMFVIGSLALAGFPYTAGFFSKDTIFAAAEGVNMPIFYILLLCSLLTALYMGRLVGLVFFGRPRSPEASHAHEGTWVYHAPLLLLAFGAIAGGSLLFYPAFSVRALAHLPHPHDPLFFKYWGFGVALAAAGVAAIYGRFGPGIFSRHLRALHHALHHGFYFDKLWAALGSLFGRLISRGFAFIDEYLISGLLQKGIGGTFSMAGLLAQFSYRGLLTTALYLILLGALLFTLISLI